MLHRVFLCSRHIRHQTFLESMCKMHSKAHTLWKKGALNTYAYLNRYVWVCVAISVCMHIHICVYSCACKMHSKACILANKGAINTYTYQNRHLYVHVCFMCVWETARMDTKAHASTLIISATLTDNHTRPHAYRAAHEQKQQPQQHTQALSNFSHTDSQTNPQAYRAAYEQTKQTQQHMQAP